MLDKVAECIDNLITFSEYMTYDRIITTQECEG